ncbi:hypothetical protein FIV36_13890 [Pseudomonas extremaustralis]|uniref:Uncharacterized protein n=1 Tax=Pseudomonas extremaustralis TaxID=359110 RepID=A0A5C5QFJ3_9PSED|nr:hypothetical protein FIV36_13890 [Pseudomonas extremaustralis]
MPTALPVLLRHRSVILPWERCPYASNHQRAVPSRRHSACRCLKPPPPHAPQNYPPAPSATCANKTRRSLPRSAVPRA